MFFIEKMMFLTENKGNKKPRYLHPGFWKLLTCKWLLPRNWFERPTAYPSGPAGGCKALYLCERARNVQGASQSCGARDWGQALRSNLF